MRKIETLEQLHAEQVRLRGVAKQMEADLSSDFNYFSNHIQPIFSIIDKLKNSTPSALMSIAGAVVPFVVNRFKKSREAKNQAEEQESFSFGSGGGWAAYAKTAIKFLVESGLSAVLLNKLMSLITPKKETNEDE